MKKNYFLLLLCLLISSLVGCVARKSDKEVNISSEQVVREYFNYWNEKKSDKLEALLAPQYKEIAWEFDKLNYIKLISINEQKAAQENKVIFDVVFDAKFKNGSGLADGKHSWSFELKRDNENSPWIIYNYGEG